MKTQNHRKEELCAREVAGKRRKHEKSALVHCNFDRAVYSRIGFGSRPSSDKSSIGAGDQYPEASGDKTSFGSRSRTAKRTSAKRAD